MKTKEKKSYFVPTIYLLIIFVVTIGVYMTKKSYDNYQEGEDFDNITYVSNSIFSRTIPIINIADIMKAPYQTEDVQIGRYFYNSDDTVDKKEQSIVYYEGTYMPNTGVDYINENVFDVLAVYDGTVIDVLEDELLGKTVQIRHNGELISAYQGLGTVDVQKGDVIFTGSKIGTSGTSKINKDLGNHLHLEIYKNGKTIDPLLCIDKKIGDI